MNSVLENTCFFPGFFPHLSKSNSSFLQTDLCLSHSTLLSGSLLLHFDNSTRCSIRTFSHCVLKYFFCFCYCSATSMRWNPLISMLYSVLLHPPLLTPHFLAILPSKFGSSTLTEFLNFSSSCSKLGPQFNCSPSTLESTLGCSFLSTATTFWPAFQTNHHHFMYLRLGFAAGSISGLERYFLLHTPTSSYHFLQVPML